MGGHNTHGARLKLIKSPIVSSRPAGSPSPYDSENGKHEVNVFETPEFQRHEEATSIELFYDLFFVANLTTFTSLHEINGSHTLRSYAGFFCILWFTWCQVSLFDVRYVSDGVLERLLKACQFAIMIGFAVVGPKFDPDNQKAATFRTLSLILAVSRFVLAFQYLIVLFHVKKYKKSKTPLALIAVTCFAAALIYLAISFAFKDKVHTRIYAAWYVVAVVEIGINITISSKWKVVSFKGTHLVQRMSLLTLIILGEGIIVVVKSIAKIVKEEFAYSTATVGNIVAAITMIYFLYMLYFDWLNMHNHFGSIRQQIWAFLHFPFHLFLVLGLEGTAQVIIVRKLGEVLAIITNTFASEFGKFTDSTSVTIDDLVSTFNETINSVFDVYPPDDAKTFSIVQEGLAQLHDATTDQTQDDAMNTVLSEVINSIYQTYGIELREKAKEMSSVEQNEKYSHVFRVLFVYFFLTIGFTIFLMNLLNYLSISHRSSGKLSLGSWLRLAFNTIISLALCAVAAVARTTFAMDYLVSPWVLPTVTIALFLMLVVNNIRKSRLHHDHGNQHDHVSYQAQQMQPLVQQPQGYVQSQPYQPYTVSH